MSTATFGWRYSDQDWTLVRPAASTIPLHVEAATVTALTDSIVGHIWPAAQDDFAAALDADEDMDIDVLTAMAADIRSIVYDPVPYASILTMWEMYVKHEPLIHGQLILGGGRGTAALDTYDAACVGLALMDEEFRQLDGWTYSAKGRPHLLDKLEIGRPKIGETQLDALAALQAEMGMAKGQTSAPAAGSRTRAAPSE